MKKQLIYLLFRPLAVQDLSTNLALRRFNTRLSHSWMTVTSSFFITFRPIIRKNGFRCFLPFLPPFLPLRFLPLLLARLERRGFFLRAYSSNCGHPQALLLGTDNRSLFKSRLFKGPFLNTSCFFLENLMSRVWLLRAIFSFRSFAFMTEKKRSFRILHKCHLRIKSN